MKVRCSVVGLGKLGESMAAAMASRGHVVIGFDVDDRSGEPLPIVALLPITCSLSAVCSPADNSIFMR